MSLLFIAIGLALLVAGGEGLVRGAVALATRLGLGRAFIGTVLLGFGTSMPELLASFGAAARGADGLAFGNVLGSNVANILLILGLSALIFPIALPADKSGLRRDLLFVGLSTLGILLWTALDSLPRLGALALLAAFAVYMVGAFRTSGEGAPGDVPAATLSTPLALGLSVLGIALMAGGAELLIRGATDLALGFGVSEAVVGITVVGVGTSLPEAVSSVIASIRRENALALGNIIGSNLFNGLAILGLSAAAFPLDLAGGIRWPDAGLLLAATLALAAVTLAARRISRPAGAVFLLLYIAYLASLVAGVGA